MSGIINNKGHKPIIVNGVVDHVHIFIGLKPAMSISDLMRDVKNNSSNFINDHNWVRGQFSWQKGYGAFSYGHSQIETVYNYVMNQSARLRYSGGGKYHSNKTFKEEYLGFLKKFEVPYEEQYLFEWIT